MYYSSIVEKIRDFISKFTPYLEDIRGRLYKLAILFALLFATGFLLTSRILKYILSFFDIQDVIIATTSPFQFADLSINIGLFTAFLISCPVFAYHMFVFLKPALTRREKGVFFSLVPIALALFFAGFAYGFAIMYYALILLAQINVHIGVQNIWDIGMFLSQIILTSTLLGVLFQFPIVVSLIVRIGIFDVYFLKKKRRLAVLIIFIFTSLLPPTDGLSLMAMALPLILLYEVTIFVNSRFRKQEIISNL